MKTIIKQIALEAGGSHYPVVGGELLQKFADLVVLRCAHVASQIDDTGAVKKAILKEFEFTND